MNPRIDICRVSFEQIVGDFRTITVIRVSIGGLKLDWSRTLNDLLMIYRFVAGLKSSKPPLCSGAQPTEWVTKERPLSAVCRSVGRCAMTIDPNGINGVDNKS